MARSSAPSRTKQIQQTIDDPQDTLDRVGELVEAALDPALTREEVIQKLQSIDELLNGDNAEDSDDDSDDDDSDDESEGDSDGDE